MEKKLPLILDGAIGSYLELKYPDLEDKFTWMSKLNIDTDSSSKLLINLYEEYLNSGADILTTNTFNSHPACFYRAYNKDANENNSKDFFDDSYTILSRENVSGAVNILKKLKNERQNNSEKVLIAGSNSPAEFCYNTTRTLTKSQLEHNHHNHINFLHQSGVDFILNETFSHLDEIKIVLDYCEGEKIPYAISLLITEDLKLLSGEDVEETIKFIDENYNPIFISLNCISYRVFLKFLNKVNISSLLNKSKLGFYLNCGSEDFNKEEKSLVPKDLESVLDEIFKYVDVGKVFCIGTCCMSDPTYTKEIYNYLKLKI